MKTVPSFRPMSPLAISRLPEGPEWLYQLKWDGYRLIAVIEAGQASLWSKNMQPMEGKFPEIAAACSRLSGTVVLDGEAVVLDPATGKPDFQRLQRRGRLRDAANAQRAVASMPVQYIVFDVLRIGEENLRELPFEERDRRLRELAQSWQAPLHTTDCFPDGRRLWDWVVHNGWEGVVCKRKSSAYKDGKAHRDWYKVKLAHTYEVEIVGIAWKDGRVASLVMQHGDNYFGKVSTGLTASLKRQLADIGQPDRAACPYPDWPKTIRHAEIRWLNTPLTARVAGAEVTAEGCLRHAKLLHLSPNAQTSNE